MIHHLTIVYGRAFPAIAQTNTPALIQEHHRIQHPRPTRGQHAYSQY
jgi:hypothetical protein